MSLSENGLLYWTVIGVLSLLVASPFLNRVLVYPRTEFFSELWILDANNRAEDYPFNITRGQYYGINLGVGNQLGYCAYYQIQVKVRNETQPSPTSFGPIENRAPSNLSSLFNITAFVANQQTWVMPLTFSFEYSWDESLSTIILEGLKLNDVWLNMSDCTVSWNPNRKGFMIFLFFELWLYNTSLRSFQYHGRFVGLWLNMTVPV